MSGLKNIREKHNLTQEELSEKSGISVRTIQRIESGTAPKGYTLKTLATTLNIPETDLLTPHIEVQTNTTTISTVANTSQNHLINYTIIKLINLSSLPFIVIPLFNILIPLALMYITKQKNTLTRQIIDVQILWSIIAPIIFLLGIFTKPGNKATLVLLIILILSNVYLILKNTWSIDKKKQLHYKLNFSIL